MAKMAEATNKIRREDYRPPDWRVLKVELHFDLSAAADGEGQHLVTVECRQLIESKTGEPGLLTLDGRDMELLSLSIDGKEQATADYRLRPDGLDLAAFPARATLTTRVQLDPFRNKSLEGLYGSRGLLCTQCEAHGFSRITYFLDRPDVLSCYQVTLLADPERYPVLLANGNRISDRTLANGLREVVWEDPHPKPCYLFAVVAGDLALVADRYRSTAGREIALEFYCDHGLEGQIAHAMVSLKAAMQFDEQAYQREYDLDLYMVVVARAFNMGAMENKGLNIFNPKCVLAHPTTATDDDHVMVEAVIGHEYLHNWTGNRITCRDWFQLALKEGLTVFREQEFSAANAGGPAQRIYEVKMLRSRQFVEDAGPLSHPVRPQAYVDMNNFYTFTVYEKGAELVRVLRHMVGAAEFARGMRRYFEHFDGHAATIEDFLSCFTDGRGPVSERMLRWYDQAGTPLLEPEFELLEAGRIRLRLKQTAPVNCTDSKSWQPVPIPVCISWLDAEGALAYADGSNEQTLLLEQAEQSFDLDLGRCAVGTLSPVFGGGFPAPVEVRFNWAPPQLAQISQQAGDPVARWWAMQQRYQQAVEGGAEHDFSDINRLVGSDINPAVLAELLSPPEATTLISRGGDADPLRIAQAHAVLEHEIATAVWANEKAAYALLGGMTGWQFTPASVAQRRLAIRVLELGTLLGADRATTTALQWAEAADNLSQRMGALISLLRAAHPKAAELLDQFAQRGAKHQQLVDRYFGLRARFATAAEFAELLDDPRYQADQPNRVRAIFDGLVRQNLAVFYAHDGRALTRFFDELVVIDAKNSQLCARLLCLLESWAGLADPWRGRLRRAMLELKPKLRSSAAHEQLSRLLGTA